MDVTTSTNRMPTKMPSKYSCIVPGCSSKSKEPGHLIPKKTIGLEWVKQIRNQDLYNLSLNDLNKYKVCYKHFEENDVMMDSSIRRLKENTVPTLNLPPAQTYEDLDENISDPVALRRDESEGKFFSGSEIGTVDADTVDNTITSIIEAEEVVTDIILNGDTEDDTITIEMDTDDMNTNATEAAKLEKVASRKRPLLKEITRSSMFSTDEKRMYDVATTTNKLYRRAQRKNCLYKKRLEKAKIYNNSLTMKKFKILTKVQQQFIDMHLKNCSKQSKVKLSAGINRIIFRHLREQGQRMQRREKLCLLLWDEVSLLPNLQYDPQLDEIIGFENWGHRRTSRLADHALVFMLKGIVGDWKIPLTFNFCQALTNSIQLMRCIKDVAKAVARCGFYILGTVCDQSQANMKCLNDLIRESTIYCYKNKKEYREGTFQINGQDIIIFYDPPHMLKGIRNNLLTKDIKVDWADLGEGLNSHFASWDIIELAYDIDQHVAFKMGDITKLTEYHIRKDKIPKMKVKHAAQVFSKSFSNFIGFLVNIGSSINTSMGTLSIPKEEAMVTAKVLRFFNDLFDSVNGHTLKSEDTLRAAVTPKSEHLKFWTEARRKLNGLRYCCKITNREKSVPSVSNWIKTIKSFELLWNVLNRENIYQLMLRRVNQDPLENFFGMIRSHGHRNVNPSCYQFQFSFKSLLINNLVSSKTVKTNCEDTADGNLLFSLENFVRSAESNDQPTYRDSALDEAFNINDNKIEITDRKPCNKTLLILKNLRKRKIFKNCTTCNETFQHLKFFQEALSISEVILQKDIASLCFRKKIIERFTLTLNNSLDFSFINCSTHFEYFCETLVHSIALNFISNWCTRINTIVVGKDIRSADDTIMKAALKYRNKHSK